MSTKREDEHQQALLRGLGLDDKSIIVNSAAMQKEELSQEEERRDVGSSRGEAVQLFGSDVELHELGQIRMCNTRRQGYART